MSEMHRQLALELGNLLTERGWIVSTAESCTGGGIATAITSVAGASGWFHAGFVCYSNDMKERVLGVNHNTLEAHGAVSEPVVKEMLQGALRLSAADCAIAVSGIAGPDGGTDSKPVGTVVIGIATPQKSVVKTYLFDGDRASIRSQTVDVGIRALMAQISQM